VLCDSVKILNVHHKIPYRYSKSHALENLITLCRSCHSKEELLVNKEFAAALVSGRQKGIKIAGNNDD
jgi:5-methylcytosine-specific restriction endonuclease McrA